MATHDVAGVLPDGEQDALALVVARTVLVRFAEVPERDRTVDGPTRSRRCGSPRRAGRGRSRRRHHAWTGRDRRPSARGGSAPGTAAADPCARRCHARTWAPIRACAARGTTGPDRHSPLWSTRARRRSRGWNVRCGCSRVTATVVTWWTDPRVTPVLPDYTGPNVRGIVPALLAPTRTSLPPWFPRWSVMLVRSSSSSSTVSGGTRSSSTVPCCPRSRRCRGPRSRPWRRARQRLRSPPSPRDSHRASTV